MGQSRGPSGRDRHRLRAGGWREVLVFALGDSENGAFWTVFQRSLKARGLGVVQLVLSDGTGVLKQAAPVLLGGAWPTLPGPLPRNVPCVKPPTSVGLLAVWQPGT